MESGFIQGLIVSGCIVVLCVSVITLTLVIVGLFKHSNFNTFINERINTIQLQLHSIQNEISITNATSEDSNEPSQAGIPTIYTTPNGKVIGSSLADFIHRLEEAGPEVSGISNQELEMLKEKMKSMGSQPGPVSDVDIERLKKRFEQLLNGEIDSDEDDDADDSDEPEPFKK